MRKIFLVTLILCMGLCGVIAKGSEKVVYVKHYNKYSGPYTDWIKDELWIANVNGTNIKRLCIGKPSFSRPIYPISRIQSPVFSKDNKKVYFQNFFNSHEIYLWRIDADGKNLRQVATYHFFDGRTLKTIRSKSPYYQITQIMAQNNKETKKTSVDGCWVIEKSCSDTKNSRYHLVCTDGSHHWQLPVESLQDVNFSNLREVQIKGYFYQKQKVVKEIERLIRSDKRMKGMKILWCDQVAGCDEIQAYVSRAQGKFPQWWLRYNKNGEFISKQLIYGE